MTVLVMELLGQIKAKSASHAIANSKPHSRQRKRLHKIRQETTTRENCAFSCPDKTSAQFSQSSILTQFPADDAVGTRPRGDRVSNLVSRNVANTPSYPDRSPNYNEQLVKPFITNRLVVSPSLYSLDMMDLELQSLRRTRAKTPCFWVGQLEEKSADSARDLADEYQAELPLRMDSPYNPIGPKILPRTVRKVKGQQSLRESLKCDRPYSSDADTLVGSLTPSSQASPTSAYFPSRFSEKYQEPTNYDHDLHQPLDEHNDIGLRICLDMLTNELATALFKQHPVENLDRASGLQIMLMIEAYESVQQRIRQDMHQLHLENQNPNHVMAAEQMLDNWIDALYALHDQSDVQMPKNLDRSIPASSRPSLSKLRHSSALESPDMFFDCEELGQNPPSYSQVH